LWPDLRKRRPVRDDTMIIGDEGAVTVCNFGHDGSRNLLPQSLRQMGE
jgi:hypothetical protein